jgi:glucose/arabinose dehydrogenase/mono/diheme cytochrome c family protein
MMKKIFLTVLNSFLIGMAVYFSSCNPETSSNSIAKDSVTIAKGKNSFVTNCASCHNFSQYGMGIGSQLAGVTADHSVEWLKNFIRDPKKVIDSGDTIAQKLFKEYKAIMPSFGYLPEDELNAIIAFIDTQKKLIRPQVKEDTNDIKNPIPDTITTSHLVVGVDSFTQIPRSSDQLPATRIIKMDYQPNTGELFVLDLRGKLYKLINGKPQVYMDMATLKPKFIDKPGLATGFGSFAFHPQFEKNGLLYTTHAEPSLSATADFNYPDSIPTTLQWVLTEWKTDPSKFSFAGTGREIFRIDMPTSIHGVQEIAFNPLSKPGDQDYGLLYIGIGDGGSTEIGFPLVSTVPQNIWGSIIRIDPSGNNSKNGKYGIPPNNPFAKAGVKNAGEVYAWGFRNPHRLNWSKSGQLFSINIGEHNIEALNMIMPGHFYGWPIREGTFMERFFNDVGKVYPLPSNDSVYHVTYPVAQFDHDEGTAISGGFEYAGKAVPQLTGKYVFGDIGTGKLFYVDMKELKLGKQATIKKWNISINGVPTTLAKLCGNTRVELRFAKDKNGELYLLTKEDGKIYRLINLK